MLFHRQLVINSGSHIFSTIWWHKKICKGKICLRKLLGETVVKLNLYCTLPVENFSNGFSPLGQITNAYSSKTILVTCRVYFRKLLRRIEGVVTFKIAESEAEGGVAYTVVFWGHDRLQDTHKKPPSPAPSVNFTTSILQKPKVT